MYDLLLREPSSEGLGSSIPVWIHPDFLQAVASLHGAKCWQLICYKGEQLVAALPVFEKRNLGISRLISPQIAYYQGLWFWWEEGRAPNRILLDELRVIGEVAEYLKKRYRLLHFNLAPHNKDVRGFVWSGLKAKPLYTFVHNLGQPYCLLRDERKKLRLAEEQNYVWEERFAPRQFIDLHKSLYTRKGKQFNIGYPELEQWLCQLQQKKLLSQFNLVKGGEIVSSNIVLSGFAEDIAYTIMRSTREEDLRLGASTLHSKLLVEALSGRYRCLDFCGANTPEVARFKAAMGFQLKVFYQITNR
ncbi:MAG: hypothetical protein GYA77_06520 [Candidatus Cloacimonetes bacterium]|nr:hypothetical protein [Candidatus Cloacimonadota bacterium]